MSLRQFMLFNVTALLGYLALASSAVTGIRLSVLFLLLIVYWLGAAVLISKTRLGNILDRRKMLAVTAVCLFSLFTFLIMDLIYGVYFNTRVRRVYEPARTLDPQLTAVELASSIPSCLKDGTPFYKPSMTVEGTITGNLYVPSPANPIELANIVEPRHVTFSTNKLGLRKSADIEHAEGIAVGDSFTFGNGVDDNANWVHLLQQQTGRAVLNAGFSGSGPEDQVARLRWLLSHGKARPKWVVWLLFEGNDLTDQRLLLTAPTVNSLTKDTLLAVLLDGLECIKTRSVVARALQGDLVIDPLSATESATRLSNGALLFDCGSLGKKLFNPADIEAASLSAPQVRRHPGFARIRQGFAAMEDMAKEANFEMVVALAPTDARVLASHCAGLSHISADSPLENEIRLLADQHHMEFVPLVAAFQNAVSQKRLYFRDDTHWNEAGHELTAQWIGKAIPTAEAKIRRSRSRQ